MEQSNYKDEMFNQISQIIEDTGSKDPAYDPNKKTLDILDVLEGLLAYALYSISNSPETVRDACEESYVNIKKNALRMMHKEKEREEKK